MRGNAGKLGKAGVPRAPGTAVTIKARARQRGIIPRFAAEAELCEIHAGLIKAATRVATRTIRVECIPSAVSVALASIKRGLGGRRGATPWCFAPRPTFRYLFPG